MVLAGSNIRIVDNSGVVLVQCIHSSFRTYVPGKIVPGTCKKLKKKRKKKRGDIVHVLLIGLKNKYSRNYRFFRGFSLKGVLVDQKGNPQNRVLKGFICRSLRSRSFFKLISLSKGFLI